MLEERENRLNIRVLMGRPWSRMPNVTATACMGAVVPGRVGESKRKQGCEVVNEALPRDLTCEGG